ncbi:hypothetical protein KZ291_33170, partial [Escherichia coli]
FSVFLFPGKKKDVEKLMDWNPKLESLSTIFPKLTAGGITPTGPAIKAATNHFVQKKRSLRGMLRSDEHYNEESGM